MRDAELFDSRLSKIDGFGDIGRSVLGTAKAKAISNAAAGKAKELQKEADKATEPALQAADEKKG